MQINSETNNLINTYANLYDQYTTVKLKFDREADSSKKADLLIDLLALENELLDQRDRFKSLLSSRPALSDSIKTELESIHECGR